MWQLLFARYACKRLQTFVPSALFDFGKTRLASRRRPFPFPARPRTERDFVSFRASFLPLVSPANKSRPAIRIPESGTSSLAVLSTPLIGEISSARLPLPGDRRRLRKSFHAVAKSKQTAWPRARALPMYKRAEKRHAPATRANCVYFYDRVKFRFSLRREPTGSSVKVDFVSFLRERGSIGSIDITASLCDSENPRSSRRSLAIVTMIDHCNDLFRIWRKIRRGSRDDLSK